VGIEGRAKGAVLSAARVQTVFAKAAPVKEESGNQGDFKGSARQGKHCHAGGCRKLYSANPSRNRSLTMTSPIVVPVSLGDRSYDILIGGGLLPQTGAFIRNVFSGQRVLVIADANLREVYAPKVLAALAAAGIEAAVVFAPAGEESKSVAELSALWDALVGGRYGRDAAIVALGGGVIGDLAGFAAASYLRGIDFIQIPTSLLAMVDSSVGGKTGINHPLGKNLLGAFWQPRLVLADTDVLQTLPRSERISALAEIIKYGVIADAAFFAWLEANITSVRDLEPAALAHAVKRSCEVKAFVVGNDERESGLREILNFGHTIGHAIENAAGYGEFRHGEAIAIGMIAEAALALGREPGWTAESQARLRALIGRAGLPTALPSDSTLTPAALLDAARSDKKNRAGAVRYVIPKRIGEVFTRKFSDAEVEPVLKGE